MDSASDTEILEEKVEVKEDKEILLTDIIPQKRMRDFPWSSSIPESIPLMLAKNHKNEDPSGWWISEKLDGVRCYWNGKTFISRTGKPYYPPDFFTSNLPPDISLDGELWLGRKQFQECVSIARCSDNGKNDMQRWHKMKYMIFDVPCLDLPFEERISFLHAVVQTVQNPYLTIVEQVKCQGLEHMFKVLEQVEKKGGEGIMLRKPQSFYQGTRSNILLKVKTFMDDEATVVGYEEGKGKYLGQIGALKVRNRKGKEFKIGSGLNDHDRIEPPKIGSLVTFKYQELSKDGIPRFPTFFRKFEGT
jgi:DNA ligase-1